MQWILSNITSIKLVSAVFRPRLTLRFFFVGPAGSLGGGGRLGGGRMRPPRRGAVAAAIARGSVAAAKRFEDF